MLRVAAAALLSALGACGGGSAGHRPSLAGATDGGVSSSGVMSETEITTSRPVTFQVRSPAPGAMGPTELAPGSDVALVEVATHLREHPELTRVSIEVRVNGLKTSSTPAVKWAVSLGQQVARRLVQQGVDCKRLEIVGYADLAPDGPAEQVRFRSGVTAEQGALTASACQAE